MRSHKILRANGTESRRSVLNFPVNQRLLYALATGDIGPLSWALQQTAKKPNAAQWVLRYATPLARTRSVHCDRSVTL